MKANILNDFITVSPYRRGYYLRGRVGNEEPKFIIQTEPEFLVFEIGMIDWVAEKELTRLQFEKLPEEIAKFPGIYFSENDGLPMVYNTHDFLESLGYIFCVEEIYPFLK